jgi:hypothetical protein
MTASSHTPMTDEELNQLVREAGGKITKVLAEYREDDPVLTREPQNYQ